MSEAEAKTKLELLVLSSEEPALSSAQVNDLVAAARRPDAEDRVHGEDGWEETWDLDAAAAEGWTRKAALAANRFNFAEDGQRFDRAQTYAHCISQAERYARRSMGSIPVGSSS